MDMKTKAREVLCLSGFPNPSQWRRGILEEVQLLESAWALKLESMATELPAGSSWPRWGMEHLFRSLDRRLFSRRLRRASDLDIMARLSAGAAGADSVHLAYSASAASQKAVRSQQPVLFVEYEDMPMEELEEAIRLRFAVPGATLNAKVWLVDPMLRQRLLFEGELDLDHRSLCKSIALCAAKLPALLHAALARIDQRGSRASAARPRLAPPAIPAYRLLLRMAGLVLDRVLYHEQWQIETFHAAAPGKTGKFSTLIKPPASAFWADPFLLRMQGRLWLLFEELPYASNKGHISAIELDEEGKPKSGAQVVLSEPWHLAFPFVFEHEGKTFMVPDASVSRALNVYECVDNDPLRWNKYATLMEGQRVADATFASYQGKLWMFCSHGDEGASMDDTLHIYWAERIEGPWHPHALNPVKIDASCARPAGAMWMQDGMLHRVVQNCATTYGGATVCTRVRVLNEHEFEEDIVPGWGRGYASPSEPWHTYNSNAHVMVVDRLRRQSRWHS